MYVQTIYWQDFTLNIDISGVAVNFYPMLFSTELK